MTGLIEPDWPAPANIRAFTRLKPASGPCVVEDSLVDLDLVPTCRLPRLMQVHGTAVVDAAAISGEAVAADACFTSLPDNACQVVTADCLPLLLCNLEGTEVAAIHAGWRGLAAGVIEATVARLHSPVDELLVWLGPAIGKHCFEVGPEVREAFLQASAADSRGDTDECFTAGQADRYMADLYGLARIRLRGLGVSGIFGGELCTFSDSRRFHSWRRDGESAGRMASLIVISQSSPHLN